LKTIPLITNQHLFDHHHDSTYVSVKLNAYDFNVYALNSAGPAGIFNNFFNFFVKIKFFIMNGL